MTPFFVITTAFFGSNDRTISNTFAVVVIVLYTFHVYETSYIDTMYTGSCRIHTVFRECLSTTYFEPCVRKRGLCFLADKKERVRRFIGLVADTGPMENE